MDVLYNGHAVKTKKQEIYREQLLTRIIESSIHMSKIRFIWDRIHLEQSPLPQATPDPC